MDKGAFRSLGQGRRPDGTTLGRVREGGAQEHHPGWDLTFRVPIRAEVGGAQPFVHARDAAVREVLKYIEEDALQVDETVRTVNLVGGRFGTIPRGKWTRRRMRCCCMSRSEATGVRRSPCVDGNGGKFCGCGRSGGGAEGVLPPRFRSSGMGRA